MVTGIRIGAGILLLLLAGTLAADDGARTEYMTNDELMRLLARGEAPVIVDVRSGYEFRKGRIPGAYHLPFYRTLYRPVELPARVDDPVVVYCEHGPRAYVARAGLRRAGFGNVKILKGHMRNWRRAGFPVE